MSHKGKTRSKEIPNHIGVDSLKIRLPLNQVNVLNPSLEGSWYLVNDLTAEIDPSVYKERSLTFKEDGITTRFAIEKQQTKDGFTDEFLTILVNSKLLKGKYFQAITKDTIEDVYRGLVAHNVIGLDFDTFYELSEVTDVDIKKDAIVPSHIYEQCINECRNISKPSKNKNKGYRYFNKKNNKGIEWSERKSTSFKNNPYLKIYHKETELKHNSNEFAEKYLNQIDYDDLVRIETTLKNAKHFRHVGIKDNKLKTVLELSQDKLQSVMSEALKSHLEPRIKQIKDDNKLTPTELIFYGSMMLCAKNGVSYESYKRNVLSLIDSKVERSRKRGVLDNIYKSFVEGTKEDKSSQEKDVFWELLKW